MSECTKRNGFAQSSSGDSIWRLSVVSVLLLSMAAIHANAQSDDVLKLLPPIGDPSSTTTIDEVIPPGAVLEPADVSSESDSILASDAIIPNDLNPLPDWLPTDWLTGPVWQYGAELGINGSSGNSQAFSILAGANAKRETQGNVFEWTLKYGKSQTAGIETQHFALFNSRWDWKFKPMWFLYNKNTFEYDEFKAFDVRLALSGGLGHHLIKNEVTTLTGRLGAGASREFGGPDNSWVPEANVGLDYEHQLSKRQRVKLTSDYYPSWEDFKDYRLVSDAFWEIKLDEAAGLSLKLGAVDRYDSTPNGRKHNDIDYFVTFIWKR